MCLLKALASASTSCEGGLHMSVTDCVQRGGCVSAPAAMPVAAFRQLLNG